MNRVITDNKFPLTDKHKQNQSNRNSKLDSVKTILIFLVVLGHTLQNSETGIMNTINLTAKIFIFTFHMPLFVAVSGYLFKNIDSIEIFFKKLIELLGTYIVFQAIRMILEGDISLSACLYSKYTLWYLLCLVYWRLYMYFASKIFSASVILLLSVVICLGSGFIQTNIMSLQRACAFLPFFVIGNIVSSKNWIPIIDSVKKFYSFCIIAFCLSFSFFYCSNYSVISLLMGKYPYGGASDMGLRLIWLIMSVILCVSIYRIIPDKPFLAKYGSTTLAVYLLHSFFTKKFSQLLQHTNLTNNFVTNTVFALLVMIVCIILSKNIIVQRLLRPIRLSKK